MSKIDVSTQELFLKLATTSQARSTKADAVFRRLRLEKSDQIAEALMRAPQRLDDEALDEKPKKRRRKKA